MDLNELETHLLLYGSDLEDWPVELRRPGEILIHADYRARSLHEEARRLDGLIEIAVFDDNAELRGAPWRSPAVSSSARARLLGSACAALLLLTIGTGFGLGYADARMEALQAAALSYAMGDLRIGEFQ